MIAGLGAKDLVPIAGGEPNDSGPSLPDGPPPLRRDSRLSGRVWSDTFASDEGNDSVVAPAAGAAVSDADTPVVRAGPAMLAADSWSVPPDPNSGVDFYLGSRRAGPRPPRVWLALAVALVGLSALVAISLAVSASHGGEDHAGAATTATPRDAHTDERSLPASLVPATGDAVQSTRPPATTQALNTRPVSGFAPMVFEAEAANITRPARALPYPGASNGAIVSGIGSWDENAGSIQFPDVAIRATGLYLITIYYVNLSHSTTSAQIIVSGVSPVTQTFTGTAVCCTKTALAPMTITSGVHTITIKNTSGPGPSIDKIVITRP